MKITKHTKAYQVAELMGNDATVTEGREMLALCRFMGFTNTEMIPDSVWQEMLKNVIVTGLSIEQNEAVKKHYSQ